MHEMQDVYVAWMCRRIIIAMVHDYVIYRVVDG